MLYIAGSLLFDAFMKHWYRLPALAAALLAGSLAAQAQHWAPFRPGAVHSFRTTVGDTLYTLRLDSAYVSGADSVYRFNRIMRQSGAERFVPSPNSFFGAHVVAKAGGREFELVSAAEGSRPTTALLLKPCAAPGSSWPAAAGSSLTVTLTAKAVQAVYGGITDSVATFSCSDGRSLLLSRRYGLVQAPMWLRAGAGSQALRLHERPVGFAQSINAPIRVFDLAVGDEFGYYFENFMSSLGCPSSHRLRRITGRQQTADSLLISYMEQTVTHRNGSPGCGPAGHTYGPILRGRVALPLNGSPWNPTGPTPHAELRLLTLEYAPLRTTSALPTTYVVARPLVQGTQCNPGWRLRYLRVSSMNQSGPYYAPGVDFGYIQHIYTAGLGETGVNFEELTAYYKLMADGAFHACGPRGDFSPLLPNRAAQAARQFQLYPNPATQEALLQLLGPAPAGTQLSLLDATGRRVWGQQVSHGQLAVRIPLSQLPAGLYVVHLQLPGETPVALRLQHQL
jgi:hypothetical protein